MKRFTLNAQQTQALTTLLATVGPCGAGAALDVYEPADNGDVDVAIWRNADATVYRITADGDTCELGAVGS